VPDLPGCFAVGATMSEARKLAAEAIEFHIRCLREAGDPVPEPSHHAEDVEVAA
jgi:predicted RNase H-like HicB family nuclease